MVRRASRGVGPVIGSFVRRVLGIDQPDVDTVGQQSDPASDGEALPDPASAALGWLKEHPNEFADEDG